MLIITIPAFEVFDEGKNEFIRIEKPTTLKLENSLLAIARWEMKYKKPYFPSAKTNNPYAPQEKPPERTEEEMRYFIKCMVINMEFEEIDDTIFYGLTKKNVDDISNYLGDPLSATVIVEDKSKKSKKKSRTLTSEVIYAWMVELQIPFEAENWNINRLMNLVQIVNEDNAPEDKKKKRAAAYDRAKNWDRINEQRLQQLGTKG